MKGLDDGTGSFPADRPGDRAATDRSL